MSAVYYETRDHRDETGTGVVERIVHSAEGWSENNIEGHIPPYARYFKKRIMPDGTEEVVATGVREVGVLGAFRPVEPLQ